MAIIVTIYTIHVYKVDIISLQSAHNLLGYSSLRILKYDSYKWQ